MVQTQKVIEQLGYTQSEARVYIAALSFEECHISDIASKLKMPLSSVQGIVEKLNKNGLMHFYVKNRYKYWVAESPERLLKQLEQREEMVRAALPSLAALRKGKGIKQGKPAVRVFTGPDEIKNIFDDIVETKHHILAIIPQDAFIDLFEGTTVLEDFIALRAKRFLRIRILVPNTAAGRALAKEEDKHLREVRFLPEHIDVQTASFIYGNKVAFIMFNQAQPTAVIIEDTGISETKAALFEDVWSHAGGENSKSLPFSKEGVFRMLADASPQPLLIANGKAEIEYVNSAWEKQFGYSLKEVQGKNPRMFQSGETPKEVYEKMWKALGEGVPFQSEEIVDKRKDGSFFNLMTTIFPLKSDGRLFYVQALDDITERKRVEKLRKEFLQTASKDIPASFEITIRKLLEDSF